MVSRNIQIDGKDFSEDVDLDGLVINFRLNEEKTATASVTESVTFIGDAYNYIKKKFFTNPCQDWKNVLKVTYSSDLCSGAKLDLEITSEGVENCELDCAINTPLTNKGEEAKCHRFLDSHWFYQNDFLKTAKLPRIWFCDQPGFLQWVVMVLRQMLATALLPVNFFTSLFDALLPGEQNPLDPLFEIIDNFISGCGRWAPGILVRDAITYQAEQCNMKFVSSIFNNPASPYNDTVIFHMEGGRYGGYDDIDDDDKAREFAEENYPAWTTIQLLKNLRELFGGENVVDYRIKDGTVYFDRIEILNSIAVPTIVDVTEKELGADIEDGPCYSFNSERLCAYGDFQYRPDPVDPEGNKAKNVYKDKVEYNDPYNEAQKGACPANPLFAPARFMFDHISEERTGFFDFDSKIDEFRDGKSGFLSKFFGNNGVIRHNDLVLTRSQTTIPKLLVLESGFDYQDAKTIKQQKNETLQTLDNLSFDELLEIAKGNNHSLVKRFYYYNYPLFYQEDLPDQIDKNELINNFLFVLNPHHPKGFKLKMDDYTFPLTCKAYSLLIENGIDVKLETHYGSARADEYELNEITKTITAKGIKIWCS